MVKTEIEVACEGLARALEAKRERERDEAARIERKGRTLYVVRGREELATLRRLDNCAY